MGWVRRSTCVTTHSTLVLSIVDVHAQCRPPLSWRDHSRSPVHLCDCIEGGPVELLLGQGLTGAKSSTLLLASPELGVLASRPNDPPMLVLPRCWLAPNSTGDHLLHSLTLTAAVDFASSIVWSGSNCGSCIPQQLLFALPSTMHQASSAALDFALGGVN
ncbi:hypothetical protein BJ912DRAFT_920521 [Pholiota molesta]|nr:hypothetical protein BJ912DRAFT_920521 [Pholiota molesta]